LVGLLVNWLFGWKDVDWIRLSHLGTSGGLLWTW